MTPDEIEKRVLYRDGLILVIDKPAGLPVHAGIGGGDNLEMFLEPLRYGLPRNPSLAHRLDRDTSGCLVLGRHPKALAKLGKLFASGQVKKTYWAIVQGEMPPEAGVIDLPLAKANDKKTSWRMKVDALHGQPARTEYRVLGRDGNTTWLELKPITGRTHQLRVHCAALGCPIIGEYLYGVPDDYKRSTMLHLQARTIEIPLSQSKPPIGVTAPPPLHMLAALARCGYEETSPES